MDACGLNACPFIFIRLQFPQNNFLKKINQQYFTELDVLN